MRTALKAPLNQNVFLNTIEQMNLPHKTQKIVTYLYQTIGFNYSITARQFALVFDMSSKQAEAELSALCGKSILRQHPRIQVERTWSINKELAVDTPEARRAQLRVISGGK
jgi:hypothetical protein